MSLKFKNLSILLFIFYSHLLMAIDCNNPFYLAAKRKYQFLPMHKLYNMAEVFLCQSKFQAYRCDEILESLPTKDQNKIIKCNAAAIRDNEFENLDLEDCIIGTVKLSINNLLDLQKLPAILIESSIKAAKEYKNCNDDKIQKTEMVKIFNLGISDPKYQFDKIFIQQSIPNINCGELENLLVSRKNIYFENHFKNSFKQSLTSQKKYVLPKDVYSDSNNLYEEITKIIDEAKINLECYTPKTKAELTCSIVTSLLTDRANGIGINKTLLAIKKIAFGKQIYRAQSNLERFSQTKFQKNQMLDILPSQRNNALEFLTKDNYSKIDYGDITKCLNSCIEKVKDGVNYSIVYDPKVVTSRVDKITKEFKDSKLGEKFLTAEINGEKIERIIVGTNSNAPVAIIGRGHDRVLSIQAGIKSETFVPSKAAVKLLEDNNDITLMLEENKQWIISVRERGLSIIDLGQGVSKIKSPFYETELVEVKNYLQNLKQH